MYILFWGANFWPWLYICVELAIPVLFWLRQNRRGGLRSCDLTDITIPAWLIHKMLFSLLPAHVFPAAPSSRYKGTQGFPHVRLRAGALLRLWVRSQIGGRLETFILWLIQTLRNLEPKNYAKNYIGRGISVFKGLVGEKLVDAQTSFYSHQKIG